MIEYPARIVARGTFEKSDIVVETIDLDPLPLEVEKLVEKRWDEELKRNPHLTPDPLLVAVDVSIIPDDGDGEQLKLICGVSNYKNFMGTTHESVAPFIDQRYWHRAIGVMSVTYTADDYIMLGIRSPKIDWGLLRHVVPAGRLKPSEHDPFSGIIAEYDEELGIKSKEIERLYCVGVVADETWGRLNYEFVFFGLVNLTVAEIVERAKSAKSAGEHCQLEAIPAYQVLPDWVIKSDPSGFVPTGMAGFWLETEGDALDPFWTPIHRTYEEHMGRRLAMLTR